MNTEELMAALRLRAANDEISRAALGFIQKTIGVLNSLPNGEEIRRSIENPQYFIGTRSDITLDSENIN